MRFHANSEKSEHEALENSRVIQHPSNFTTKTERVPTRALPLVRRGRRCAVVGLPLCLPASVVSRQRARMYGLLGAHPPVSGTSPQVPHTLTTVHPVPPPLLQHALP